MRCFTLGKVVRASVFELDRSIRSQASAGPHVQSSHRHADLWRTRGTYFWSLFRENPRIRAFDEPLHEGLANKTDQQWFFDFKFGARRTLRHPTVDRHYFSEYPIRPQGGVPLFKPSLSFDGFIADETDEDSSLADYLRSLVRFAAAQDQQAYFRFTRGGLRAALTSAYWAAHRSIQSAAVRVAGVVLGRRAA